MYKGVFVTGTDTGVGKTYVACTLVRALREYGISTTVFKPLATWDREDAKKLIEVSGTTEPLEKVNPVFLKYPLAPMVSAQLSGKTVDLNLIWKTFAEFKKKYEFTVVEGIGGLMVPIKRRYFVLDMIKRLSLPAIVVGRPFLGTINHTLLTVDKLRQQGVEIAGIVLSCRQSSTLAEKTNPEVIRQLTGLPVLEIPCKHELNLEQNLWMIGEK
ncbi:MAG: dethiobiotin synthase [Endomicrobiales bacterium]